ncbi:MAG: co-chaperone YbbN [Magnetovibrio sp.]|nr:co-chaperone YbbN [Magnetovibrio sp.]|tara:strand:- start:2325 stop:3236 length:912 start_codon:yes stop_codon:yes gene_type:complete
MIIEEDGTTISTSNSTQVIKEGNMASFVADVVEESKNIPIIVEFYISHSDTGNKFSQILEKIVTQLGGIVKLVKLNLEENRQLAAQLQVQTAPTVFGFKNGQPIDAFAGPQPESQIKAFIKRLTGNTKTPMDEVLDQAEQLIEEGDPEQAKILYSQILAQDDTNGTATSGLIRCYVATGEIDKATSFAANLQGALLNHPEVQAARSALELAKASEASGDIQEYISKLEVNNNDHQARFDLAICLYGSGQSKQALDELLKIIRIDRNWNDEAARKQMIKIFEALGADNPVTIQARRDLSTILFS